MALMRRQPQGGLSPANAAGRHGGHGPSCPVWGWFGWCENGQVSSGDFFGFICGFFQVNHDGLINPTHFLDADRKKVQLKFGMGYGNVTIATM